jgi:hypothetical protein
MAGFPPNDFGSNGPASPEVTRQVAQRTVAEVNNRMRNADTRLRCLGLAVELNTGTGLHPSQVIDQAEAFMAWIISGENPRYVPGPGETGGKA